MPSCFFQCYNSILGFISKLECVGITPHCGIQVKTTYRGEAPIGCPGHGRKIAYREGVGVTTACHQLCHHASCSDWLSGPALSCVCGYNPPPPSRHQPPVLTPSVPPLGKSSSPPSSLMSVTLRLTHSALLSRAGHQSRVTPSSSSRSHRATPRCLLGKSRECRTAQLSFPCANHCLTPSLPSCAGRRLLERIAV
jgi:hypothetical protein